MKVAPVLRCLPQARNQAEICVLLFFFITIRPGENRSKSDDSKSYDIERAKRDDVKCVTVAGTKRLFPWQDSRSETFCLFLSAPPPQQLTSMYRKTVSHCRIFGSSVWREIFRVLCEEECFFPRPNLIMDYECCSESKSERCFHRKSLVPQFSIPSDSREKLRHLTSTAKPSLPTTCIFYSSHLITARKITRISPTQAKPHRKAKAGWEKKS